MWKAISFHPKNFSRWDCHSEEYTIEAYVRLSRSFYSFCDSRNLNLSPFCNLTSTSLAMWQASVLETYGNQTTSYIDGISGPMRVNFPNSMEERELITALAKVAFLHLRFKKLLGGDVLQRLWEGYRHCKHLLWGANRIRWVHICYNWKSIYLQSLRGCQRWLGWTLFLALAASVDFALGSALPLLLRFSIGFPSGSVGSFDLRKWDNCSM